MTARREPLGITRLINAASSGSRRTLSCTDALRFQALDAIAVSHLASQVLAIIVPYSSQIRLHFDLAGVSRQRGAK